MASDMVVALGGTTVDHRAIFGHNAGQPAGEVPLLQRGAGRSFTPGEKVHTQYLELPQHRQTFTVVGSQPRGRWGFLHGVNDHGLAIGCTDVRTRLQGERPGLTGTDLVRLGLERAATARQAVELLTDLVTRHGQGAFPGCSATERRDSALLIADAHEAFALETTGAYWVYQEVQQVRAMSDVCTIRQDWDCIARGLSGHAIENGWWPGDGSKLDFAQAVGGAVPAEEFAHRRWGRATLLLEEQNGHIDIAFIRRLLSDHYEIGRFEAAPPHSSRGPTPLCQHDDGLGRAATAASLVAPLGGMPLAWCAFGPPCTSLYFPVLLDGELPPALGAGDSETASESAGQMFQRLGGLIDGDPERWALVRMAFNQLQARLDQEVEEFLAESASRRTSAPAEFQRLAGLFMQHAVERFENVAEGLSESLTRSATFALHGAKG